MPDIGVLELQIHDNGKEAGDGLGALADALSRIKRAADPAKSISLGPVATQIVSFAKKINKETSTGNAVKQVTNFFNAVSAFAKVKKIDIDTEPLTKLKDTVNAFSVGDTGSQLKDIREALAKDWDGSRAVASMGGVVGVANAFASHDTAKKIKAVVDIMGKYTTAYKELPKSTKKLENIIEKIRSSGPFDIEAFNEEARKNWESSDRKGRMFPALQRYASNSVFKTVEENVQPAKAGLESISESIDKVNVRAEMATKTIQRLFDRLDAGKNKRTKGYDKIVEAFTGVSRPTTNIAETSAGTFMRFPEQIDAVEKAIDEATEAQRKIEEAAQRSWNIEDLRNIPASGLNGPFQNAREEVDRLNQQISTSIENMYYWDKVYKDTQKRIKYNGETEERKNMLGHAEEGYFSSMQDVEGTREKLAQVYDYIDNYVAKAKDATSAANEAAASTREFATNTREIKGGADEADRLANRLNAIVAYSETWNKLSKDDKELSKKVYKNDDLVSGVIEKLESYKGDKLQQFTEAIKQITDQSVDAKEKVSQLYALLQNGIPDMTQVENAAKPIAEVKREIKPAQKITMSLDEALAELNGEAKKTAFSFSALKDGIKKMFPTMSGMLKRFRQIARYRMLRAVLKHITEGFSEGVENVYNYSKAVGTSLAPAMDQAATSFQLMKNSIGAATAPLIEAFVPVIQTVVNWFVTLINYINQFLALMRGQATWTRALPATATAFGKQEKAAKGAANAIKDLLADWDELNIIQSETGGGGLGSSTEAAEDYLSMFEEVDKYDDAIRGIVKFLQENMTQILISAGAIAVAMKTWGISKALSESLPMLSKIALGAGTLATIAVSLTFTDLFGKAYVDSGEVGWLFADAVSGAVGPYIASQLMTKLTGSEAAGTVTAGFTLALEGLVNIKNAQSAMANLKEGQAWALAALGAIQVGTGIALAGKGFGLLTTFGSIFATGVVAASATLLLTAAILLETKRDATYTQMAYDAFAKTGEDGLSVTDYTAALQTRFDELTEGGKIVIDAMVGFTESDDNFKNTVKQLKSLNRFITSGQSLTEEQAQEFQNAWDIVFNELDRLGTISYQTIFAGLEEALKSGTNEIKEAAKELMNAEVEVARLTGGARQAAQEEMNQILREITNGDTRRAERYFELYNIWGENEEQQQVNKYVDDILAQRIKFTEGGNPVEEAEAFLTNIQEQMVNPALELVQQQYDAEIQGLAQQREDLQKAYESNYISKDQLDQSVAQLDLIQELFEKRLKEQQEQISKAVDNAYDVITEQLYEGYFNISDDMARQKYIDEVMAPILEVYEAAGRQLPAKIQALMQLRSEGTANSRMVAGVAELSGRAQMYQILYDEIFGESDDLKVNINKILAGEGLNMQSNIQNLNIADYQEIVNSLLPLFAETYAGDIIDYIASTYGIDRGKLLEGIDYRSLVGRQYTSSAGETYDYDIQEMIDSLNEYIRDYNYNNPQQTIPTINVNIGNAATADGIMAGTFFGARTDTRVSTGEEEAAMADGVKAGTNEGFQRLSENLETVATWLQRLYNKDTTVKITPSSTAGLWTQVSNMLLSNVTGEVGG